MVASINYAGQEWKKDALAEQHEQGQCHDTITKRSDEIREMKRG